MIVRELHSTVILIFRPDEIPFPVLSRDDIADRLGVRYSLTQEKPPFSMPGTQANLVYSNGVFDVDRTKYLVDRVAVEPRRILITVAGPTNVALAVFEDLKSFIQEVDLRSSDFDYEPVSTTHESQTSVKLGFDFDRLLAGSQLADLSEEFERSLPGYGAQVDVYPVSVRFRVAYRNQPERLSRNRISLVDKIVALEVKDKTDPAECLYSSLLPTDSDTHLELLSSIEHRVSQQ